MPETTQLPLFIINEAKLTAFLTRYTAIEDAEERLREEKRLLKEDYANHLPLRATVTAVKIVRARRKLETHAKEPCPREHQAALEAKVEAYLDIVAAAEELMQVGQGRFAVNLTTGEVQDAPAPA